MFRKYLGAGTPKRAGPKAGKNYWWLRRLRANKRAPPPNRISNAPAQISWPPLNPVSASGREPPVGATAADVVVAGTSLADDVAVTEESVVVADGVVVNGSVVVVAVVVVSVVGIGVVVVVVVTVVTVPQTNQWLIWGMLPPSFSGARKSSHGGVADRPFSPGT